MNKFRIVLVDTTTALGHPVKWYAVQKRVALFWWVTVAHASQLSQARYWLNKSGEPHRKEKLLRIIE